MAWTIHHGDCREVMATLDAESVDAIVSDPPYGLSFMGKGWDHGVPGVEFWTEALRVAKPGAHLLAFGGTRTYHRLACAIEDAGWEIRDCVMWVYGSGFPKSHNLKGEWQGWGTALKPAWEPIIVARKPLVGTVAENVLTHGTGGINVDGCRVGIDGSDLEQMSGRSGKRTSPHLLQGMPATSWEPTASGRWPANLIHDGSEEVVGLFPQTMSGSGLRRPQDWKSRNAYGYSKSVNGASDYQRDADSGSAARFFYCAKASKADRDEGCEGLPQTIKQSVAHGDKRHGTLPYTNEPREMNPRPRGNHHPTVKPADLMRYLCRLVTPPGGVVLDPFTGSGSTGKGAVLEGFRFIGIEREAEYVEIAKARIAAVSGGGTLF
jgi:site-specific DNA-methyltransferase (adenine-specific)